LALKHGDGLTIAAIVVARHGRLGTTTLPICGITAHLF
jgi:hypothetical protein